MKLNIVMLESEANLCLSEANNVLQCCPKIKLYWQAKMQPIRNITGYNFPLDSPAILLLCYIKRVEEWNLEFIINREFAARMHTAANWGKKSSHLTLKGIEKEFSTL